VGVAFGDGLEVRPVDDGFEQLLNRSIAATAERQ